MNNEKLQKLILENQVKIMRFFAFGFPELRTDEILTEGIIDQIRKTQEALTKEKKLERLIDDSISNYKRIKIIIVRMKQ